MHDCCLAWLGLFGLTVLGCAGVEKVENAVPAPDPDLLEVAVERGLDWLARHQDEAGGWSAATFSTCCGPGATTCTGSGRGEHDVGVTGLALLALLGSGDTLHDGRYRDAIRRGVGWLVGQQDRDTGLVGTAASAEFFYDHAIATLAMSEALAGSKDPILERAVERAVESCLKARNEYAAWRYSVPPNGDNDTSVTGWMTYALASASDEGVEIGTAPFAGVAAWLEEVTDPETGRAGYTARGESSSRDASVIGAYSPHLTEALTAMALHSRLRIHDALGGDAGSDRMIALGQEVLLSRLPEWDPNGGGPDEGWTPEDHGATNDMIFWYFGTLAMARLGGDEWTRWRAAIARSTLPNQRVEPVCAAGSWDPGGPWGHVGGRVYSTALLVQCLQRVVDPEDSILEPEDIVHVRRDPGTCAFGKQFDG